MKIKGCFLGEGKDFHGTNQSPSPQLEAPLARSSCSWWTTACQCWKSAKTGNLRIFYKQLSLMESPLRWTASAQLHLRFFSICLRTEAMQATLFCVFLCPEDRCTSYVAKWDGMLRLSVPPKRTLDTPQLNFRYLWTLTTSNGDCNPQKLIPSTTSKPGQSDNLHSPNKCPHLVKASNSSWKSGLSLKQQWLAVSFWFPHGKIS